MGWLKETERIVAAIADPPDLRLPPGLSALEIEDLYDRFEDEALRPLLRRWEELGVNQVFENVEDLLGGLSWFGGSSNLVMKNLEFVLPTVVGREMVVFQVTDEREVARHLDLGPYDPGPDFIWVAVWAGGSGKESAGGTLSSALKASKVNPEAVLSPYLTRGLNGLVPRLPPKVGYDPATFLGIRMSLDCDFLETKYYGRDEAVRTSLFSLDSETFRRLIDQGLAEFVLELGKRAGVLKDKGT